MARAKSVNRSAEKREPGQDLKSKTSSPSPQSPAPQSPAARIRVRMKRMNWGAVEKSLDAGGYAKTPVLLTAADCNTLTGLFEDDGKFRSRIDMSRYRFGEGRYAYFAYPLPQTVAALREEAYRYLAPTANRWRSHLKLERAFPPKLEEYLAQCHRQDQLRPTPLLLRYERGGYNCLHQDRYGPMYFPLQMVVMLSRAGADYEGGEFMLVENRPRAQSVGHVITLQRGQGLIFPGIERPVRGTRGTYRISLRHGVSRIGKGIRHTLGIIFHDAA